MDITAINRLLFRAKDFSVRSFMRVPSITGYGHTATVACTPVIFISYDPKRDYNAPVLEQNSYKVTARNLIRFKEFLEQCMEWMNPVKYPDMFIHDEHEGRLMLNMDYSNLKILIRSISWEVQVIQAVPMVVTWDNKQSPGVMFSINRTNYSVALTDEDLFALAGVFDNFSFQTETLLLTELASKMALWEKQDDARHAKFIPSTSTKPSNGRKIEW